MSYSAEASPGAKSFLIVDDSAVVRKIARRILEGLQFSVQEAANGELGLQICNQRMPDGILLDWNMPVMNGIDFLRSLRSVQGGDSPIVLFCTTESDVGHIQEAIEAGANEYIIKPFDSDILQEKLGATGLT